MKMMNESIHDHDTTSESDTVEQLVKLAGKREAVPEEREARVRRAVHEAWQREVLEVRSGRRRRYLAGGSVAAGLAAAAVLALSLGWPPTKRPPAPGGDGTIPRGDAVATVEMLQGTVHEHANAATISSGAMLVGGSEIETGSDGRLALVLADGGPAVRLDVDTRLVLRSPAALELLAGAVYVDRVSPPGSPPGERPGADDGIEVITSLGVARDVGTQFEVRLDGMAPTPRGNQEGEGPTLRIRVREGEVHFDHEGETHTATAGIELAVDGEGAVERRPVALSGAEWSWILGVAPGFDMEGQTLDQYLDWLARETGWEIRFRDPEVERRVEKEQMHGPIEGLRPDETPDIVLPIYGLEGRLEDGTLWIDSFTP